MDDKLLSELKQRWLTSQKPHLTMLEFEIRNKAILEREGDEEKRKIVEDFLTFLQNNIKNISPELVKTQTGYGLFLDYSTLLKEQFSILFHKFENDNEDLGYWVEDDKRLYINVLDANKFNIILVSKQYEQLFDIYHSTIFHELIHMFDHMRYSGSHKPADYGAYMNTYEEFNAFYQQYARSIDKIVKNMKTLDDFYKRFGIGAGQLINEFWNNMPDEMKQEITSSKKWTNKWNKRVYQLYYEKLNNFVNEHQIGKH